MIIFAYLITILTTSCHSQTIGSTVYAMRLLNNSICAGEHIISFNGSSSLHKTIFFWNGYINVHRDFIVDTNLVYVTRWHYVGVCDHTTTVAVNGSSQLYQTFEVWNGIVNVTQDLILDKVLFLFLKCAQGYYACERFLTVKVDKNLKDFLYAKQAGWATLWKSLHPQPKLPYIHKGIYTVTNLTIDVNLMLTMIPEFADYSWIIKCIIYDKKDNQQACGEINLHIVKYTHRDRDRKRKRKN